MYTALLLSLCLLLVLINASNNEFTAPPPTGGTKVTDGEAVEIKWRCDDCVSDIQLGVFQARNDLDGTWAQEFFFSKL
jgi:hypothetical protein